MKQISIQEALRAVADGKEVFVDNFDGNSHPLTLVDELVVTFSKRRKYFIKETVKVALFKRIDSGELYAVIKKDLNPAFYKRVSDLIDIEVNE